MALRDDYRDVVVLIRGAELSDFIQNRIKKRLGRKLAILPQGIGKSFLSKFFSVWVRGFRYAVCIQRENIAWKKAALFDFACPMLKEAQDRARRLQPLKVAVRAEEKSRQMAAIGIAETSRPVVVFGKEKRRVGVIRGVFVEEPVHRLEEPLRIVHRNCALAAQIRL